MGLRLVCYGWVAADTGSMPSANHLLLREMLRRDISVDLYADRGSAPRPEGLDPRLGYIGLDAPGWIHRLPRGGNWALYPVVRRAWQRTFVPQALARHRTVPYDAMLTLGTGPAFVIPGVPVVSWLQGPKSSELGAIRRLRHEITTDHGRTTYAALTGFYTARRWLERDSLKACDHLICGSTWSKRQLVSEGWPEARVHAVPYAIDLDRFRPAVTDADMERPTILSLGRLDPRKRIDLVIDGFEALARRIPEARLLIVGRPGYLKGRRELVRRRTNERIRYRPAVGRNEVVPLLRSAAVLVQPSIHEDFGSSVAEALACGTPVVVGPTNGTADYISPDSQVATDDTPEAVADALEAVLTARRNDPVGVGGRARTTAVRWFTPERVADHVLEIVAGAHASA